MKFKKRDLLHSFLIGCFLLSSTLISNCSKKKEERLESILEDEKQQTQTVQLLYKKVNSSLDNRALNKIVFVSDRNGNKDLYVMDFLNKGVEQITSTPENEEFPFWFSDGRIGYLKGNEFFVIDIDGRNNKQITQGAQSERLYPSVSKDGKYIVYSSTHKEKMKFGNTEGFAYLGRKIFLLDLSTGEERLLTQDYADRPNFTLDGRIVFELYDGPNTFNDVISFVNLNGNITRTEAKSHEGDGLMNPVISPDGTKLAFVAHISNKVREDFYPYTGIILTDLIGKSQQPLIEIGNVRHYNYSITFSPDSKQIVFVKGLGETDKLFIVDLEGNVKQLTFGDYNDNEPRWFNYQRGSLNVRLSERENIEYTYQGIEKEEKSKSVIKNVTDDDVKNARYFDDDRDMGFDGFFRDGEYKRDNLIARISDTYLSDIDYDGDKDAIIFIDSFLEEAGRSRYSLYVLRNDNGTLTQMRYKNIIDSIDKHKLFGLSSSSSSRSGYEILVTYENIDMNRAFSFEYSIDKNFNIILRNSYSKSSFDLPVH